MKLYVAMVGLPARGKSTLAKRIRSGLEQQGIRTAIFNNGELRRMLFGLESGSAEFFNPDNTRAQRLRDQITHQNMERARAWLDEGGDVAIIDATNGTVHQRVDLSATLRDRPVLFIECVNDDPLLLDASIRRKTRLPEFANMTQEEALESFRKRLAYYESVYTPVRKERCWIRVDAVDSCIQDEAPSNDLPYYAAIRDIISSRWVQDLYLVRHGETDYNREGRLMPFMTLLFPRLNSAKSRPKSSPRISTAWIFRTFLHPRSSVPPRRPRRCCVRVRTPSAWP